MLYIHALFCISYHSNKAFSLVLMLYLRFPCNDLTSNSCLYSDLKHLPRYGVFESLTHGFPCAVRTVSVMKTHLSEPKPSVKHYCSPLPARKKKREQSLTSTVLTKSPQNTVADNEISYLVIPNECR